MEEESVEVEVPEAADNTVEQAPVEAEAPDLEMDDRDRVEGLAD